MEDKKKVEEITSRDKDFAKWYTDIVRKAGLMDYSSVRGCMVIEPYGYAIWENIQSILDKKFKEAGHVNVMMPMFIPESLLQKEKDHVEGFAPEVAWVTHGGEEKLQERLCVRPTSETLFCEYYSRSIKSWRDLPKLYNQWCSVVRWEKTTRPFLRSCEFLWQEGHTVHETSKEAEDETKKMIGVYADFFRKYLSIPVLEGRKTDKEKFAGAKYTFTIEAMMHDGRALQSGTSHYFGDGFAKAFDIKYQNRENNQSYPFQTSWGMTTRVIGAIIMVHGDDNGLILPPEVAPIQVVIVPINLKNEKVKYTVENIFERLKDVCRVHLDKSDQTPGWKFAEYEMKGVPLRIEIGPRDMEKGECTFVRRDTGEKSLEKLAEIHKKVPIYLKNIKENMYKNASYRMQSMICEAKDMDQFKEKAKNPGFIKAAWCGGLSCEEKIKEETGFTSRCIAEEKVLDKCCTVCSKEAKNTVYWGKSY